MTAGRPASARPRPAPARRPPTRRAPARDPPAQTRLDSSWASSSGSTKAGSSRSTCTRSAQRPGLEGAEVGAADRGRAVAGGHQQQLGRGERGRVRRCPPGRAGRPAGPRAHRSRSSPDAGPSVPSPTRTPARRSAVTRATPAASFALEPGQCATAAPRRGEQGDVGVGQLHGVRGQHPAVEQRRRRRAARAPTRTRRAARGPPRRVSATWMCTSAPALPGVLADRRQRLGAAACTPRAGRSRARSARPARTAGRPRRSGPRRRRASAPSVPSRSQPGAAMIPGVSSDAGADGGHRVDHGVGEEVHLDAGRAAGAQQLDAARGHARRARRRRGQPGLRGPHHLVQPAHQRQVAAQPAQRRHRGVRVRVDQARQQRPGQRPHRRVGRRRARPAGRRRRSGRRRRRRRPRRAGPSSPGRRGGRPGAVSRTAVVTGAAPAATRSDRNGGSQAPPSGSESRVIRGSGSRNTPSMSSRSTNSITSEVSAKLACSRNPMTVTSVPRRAQLLERLAEGPPVAGGHDDPCCSCALVGAEPDVAEHVVVDIGVFGRLRLGEDGEADVAQRLHPRPDDLGAARARRW